MLALRSNHILRMLTAQGLLQTDPKRNGRGTARRSLGRLSRPAKAPRDCVPMTGRRGLACLLSSMTAMRALCPHPQKPH